MTIAEALENALLFIEAKNGHKNGAIYEDLAAALESIKSRPSVAGELI